MNNKSSNLHKKANPWRILVLVVKWRHHENGILTREKGRLFTNASLKRLVRSYGLDIQLSQKTLSEEKQKVFKPRPQGNVGCFKSVFCWQTITPLNWSLIFIRHLHWTLLIILVFKICFKSFPTFRSPLTYRKTFHTVLRDILARPFGLGLKSFCFSSDNVFWNNCIHLI